MRIVSITTTFDALAYAKELECAGLYAGTS